MEATAALTATDAPTATDTPLPPTSTSTPTDTPHPTASRTPSSTPTATNAHVPTPTDGPAPTAATQVSASQPTASASTAERERRLAVLYGGSNLYVIDVTTGSESQIISTSWQEAVRSAAWSPDGWVILVGFSRYQTTNGTILRAMNADGSDWRDLINGADQGASVTDAIWSPDGKTIAMRYVSGNDFGVWIANSDGTGLRGLDSTSIHDFPRFWSVDGDWVIAFSKADGTLYALEVEGSRRVPLAQLDGLQVYDQYYYPWRITDQPSCDIDADSSWYYSGFWDCQ